MDTFYSLSAKTIAGETFDFANLRDKVVLIVNTASGCGFTPQFAGLQKLHERYSAQGLVILAFPCNQFGAQEPLQGQQITQFCQTQYGVQFAIMQKIDVNGAHAHPVYQWLKSQKSGLLTDHIKWNFTKFLIDKNGRVIQRYAPTTSPEKLERDIQRALNN